MKIGNEEKFKQIKLLHKNGSTVEQIATQFGYKNDSVKWILTRSGISTAKSYVKQHEQAEKMKLDGKTIKEISITVGLSESNISSHFVKTGLSKKKNNDRGVDYLKIDENKLIYSNSENRKIKPYVDFNSGKKYTEINEILFQQHNIQTISI